MNIEAQQITRRDQPRWVDADTHRFLESIAEAYVPVMIRRIGEIAYDMSNKNGDEEVSRMHANGLCELIAEDTAMESSVQTDENENFIGVSGTRRVLDVLIDGKPLNPERMYTIATTSFLIGGGDGYKMFADHAEVIGTTQKVDNILLADYIEKNLSGTIPPSYRQGTRIHEIQQ